MGGWYTTLLMMLLGVLLAGCSMSRSAAQRELLVTVDDAGYAPKTLEAQAGEQIRLTLKNIGTQEHHFAIQEISIATTGGGMDMSGMSGDMSSMGSMPELHLVAAAGTSNMLEFTPTQAGQYEFKCIVPGHMETGTLVVQG